MKTNERTEQEFGGRGRENPRRGTWKEYARTYIYICVGVCGCGAISGCARILFARIRCFRTLPVLFPSLAPVSLSPLFLSLCPVPRSTPFPLSFFPSLSLYPPLSPSPSLSLVPFSRKGLSTIPGNCAWRESFGGREIVRESETEKDGGKGEGKQERGDKKGSARNRRHPIKRL